MKAVLNRIMKYDLYHVQKICFWRSVCRVDGPLPVHGRFRGLDTRHVSSTSSLLLAVRRTRLSTVGDRTFPVAAACTWNSLTQHLMSTPSTCMSVHRGRLEAFLFRRSFP